LSEWSNRAGSILHGQSLTASKLIGIIKLFSMDILSSKTAMELNINQTKVQRMFEVLRKIIVGKKSVDIDDSLLKKHSPTFSLSITDDIVSIGVAVSIKSEKDLFVLKRTRVPNREVAFIFQHSKVNSKEIRRKLDNMPVKQNHFWRYANQRLQFFRGTKAKHLFQHLKEIEFKYNNRNENIFEKLVTKIARF
jgi:transposase-like protein